MTISLENDNHVIVYAMEKVISYARSTQQMIVAQCGRWLASIIGLEPGLIIHIDNLRERLIITTTPWDIQEEQSLSSSTSDFQEDSEELKSERQDKILEDSEEVFQSSQRLREIASLKATSKTHSGCINPLGSTKKSLRIQKLHFNRNYLKTEGICLIEIDSRKEKGECFRCAWPSDRKGAHRGSLCIGPIKLSTGTVERPEAKWYAVQHSSKEE